MLFERAAADGLLSKLAASDFRHCTSMYVDGVVTFFRPTKLDLLACAPLGRTLVWRQVCARMPKCSLHLIRCHPEQVELARSILGCEVASFPFKYLGLPVGLER
jgi:hypothetical protein